MTENPSPKPEAIELRLRRIKVVMDGRRRQVRQLRAELYRYRDLLNINQARAQTIWNTSAKIAKDLQLVLGETP